MPYSAGTAYLQVVPSFRDVERTLAKEAAKIGQEVNKAVRDAVPKGMKEGLQEGAKEVEKEGQRVAEAFSDAFSGAFGRTFHKQIESAFTSIPKLDIEGLTGVHAQIEAVRADLESLHSQHIGIDIDERTAIAAFENMHRRIRELRQELELDPNSSVGDIHNLRVANAQLEALQSTVDDARRYGHLAGDEYGGAWATEVRRRIEGALKQLPDIRVTADSSDVDRAMAALRGQLVGLRDVKVGVDMDEGRFLAKVKFIEAQLDELGQRTTSNKMQFDIDAAREQLRALVDTVMPEAGDKAAERFGGAFSTSLQRHLDAAMASLPEIELQANSSGVDRAMVRIRAEIAALSDVTIGVDMDAETMLVKLAFLEEQLKALAARDVSIDVKFDLDRAREELVKFRDTVVEQEAEKIAERFGGAFSDGLRRRLGAAAGNLPEIQLQADSSGADRAIVRIRAEIAALSDVTIGVDMDAETMLVKLAFLEEQMKVLAERGVTIDAKFDLERAREELVKFRETVIPKEAEETGREYGGAFATQVGQRLQSALKALPNIELTPDTKGAEFAIAAIRLEIERLSGKTIGIDVDEGRALAELKALKEWLDEIARTDPNIRVQVEAGAASAELLAILKLAKMVDESDPKVRVKADDAKTASQSIMELADAAAFGGSRLGYLVAISMTLGTILVPAAAAAAMSIGAIGTAAAGVGAGIGVAILGFSGVVGAVQALNKYQNDTSKSAASLATSQGTLAGALDSVQSAERGLANTRQQVASQNKSSAQAIVDAQRGVTDMQRQARQAVLDLQAAYEQARRAEQDRTLALRDNALAQRQANLDIADAKRQLDTILANPRSTQAEREQAQVTYEQRLLQLDRLRVEGQRAADDKSKADKAGIAGSQQVQAAQDRVRSTTEAVAQAQRRLADSIDAQQQQQRQGQFQLAQAAQAVAAAQRQVEQASTRAGVAGGAAMTNLDLAMSQLTPTGQRFARFLFGLKDDFLSIRAAAEEGMLPGVQRAIEAFLPYFPRIKTFVGEVASALGGMAENFVGQMQNPVWQHFFGFLADSAVPALRGVYQFSMNVAQGLASLFLALTPFNKQIGGGLIDMSERFAKWAGALSETSGYQTFLAYVERSGPKVVDLLGQLGELAVKIIVGAAPVGEMVLRFFTAMADGLNNLPTWVFATLLGSFAALMTVILPLIGVLKVYKIGVESVTASKLAWGKASEVVTAVFGRLSSAVPEAATKTQQFGFALQQVEEKTAKTGKGLSGLTGFLGGPWAIAFQAAALAVGYFIEQNMAANARVEGLKGSLVGLADAYDKGNTALNDYLVGQLKADENFRRMIRNSSDLGLSVGTVTDAVHGNREALDQVNSSYDDQIKKLQAASTLLNNPEARWGEQAAQAMQLEMEVRKKYGVSVEDRIKQLKEEKKSVNSAVDGYHEIRVALGLATDETSKMTLQTGGLNAVLRDNKSGVDDFKAALGNLSDSGIDAIGKASALAAVSERIAESHLGAAQKAGLFRDVLGQLGSTARSSGPVFDSIASVFGNIADSALSASDKTSLLKQAMDQMYGGAISQNEANESLISSQDRLAQQMGSNSAGFDLNTAASGTNREAILRNRDSLEAALLASRDKYVADIAAGESEEAARKAHEATTTAITNQIDPTYRDSAAVHDLVQKYGAIPPERHTKITSEGSDKVMRDLYQGFLFQQALKEGLTPDDELRKHGSYEFWSSPQGLGNQGAQNRADGGAITGWSPHKRADNIPAWLTAGEWVQPVDSVNYYGQDVMEAMRQRLIPRELLSPPVLGAVNAFVTPRSGVYPGDGSSGIRFADGGSVVEPYTVSWRDVMMPVSLADLKRRLDRQEYGWSGPVPQNVQEIQQWLRAQDGKPYIWASAGPVGFDCSGIISAVYNLMRGEYPYQHTFSTYDEGNYLTKPGYGLLTAGWTNPGEPGPGGDGVGHTAAMLAGLRFESTGDHVRVGHDVTPLTSFAHLAHAFADGGLVDALQPRLFDEGGLLQPGWNPPIWNGTGTVEPVLNPQQWSDMARIAAVAGQAPGDTSYHFQFADTTLTPSRLRAMQAEDAIRAREGRAR